jgi:hypothetical protein
VEIIPAAEILRKMIHEIVFAVLLSQFCIMAGINIEREVGKGRKLCKELTRSGHRFLA